jgi:hypothetical protein
MLTCSARDRLNHVLHIAAVVQLRHDTEGRAYFRRKRAEGKGGLESSAADLTPHVGTSDQPQPGPTASTLPPARVPSPPRAASAAATPRRRTRGVKTQRPTGRTVLTPTNAGAP